MKKAKYNKNLNKKVINRPSMSMWKRTSALWIWYTAQFLIALIIFCSFNSLRLVCRAIDVISNEAIYRTFDKLSLQLIFECVVILLSFYYVVRNAVLLYGVYVNVNRIKDADDLLTSGGNSYGFEGEQGVGKTRSMVYASMLLAEKRAEDLCYKYYVDLPIREKLLEDKRFVELRKFNAREQSFYYNFVATPNNIPTLHANVDVIYLGKHPHELNVKHFEMKERLYENNVKILTEADDFFPNTMRKKKKAKDKDKKEDENDENEINVDINAVDKFVGLDRQYTNGTLISDTHANGDIFKGIRTCQSFTLFLTRAEYRYTPNILKKLEKILINKVLKIGDTLFTPNFKKSKEKNEFYSKFYAKDTTYEAKLELISRNITEKTTNTALKKLEKARKRVKKVQELMKKISITRIYYRKISGPGEFQSAEKEEFYVLPNQVPYVYDDRMFHKEYKFNSDTAKQ